MTSPIALQHQPPPAPEGRQMMSVTPLHVAVASRTSCPSLHSASRGECEHCTRLLFALNESQAQLREARAQLERIQQSERAARHMADHDGLTALPNRRAFLERLSEALGRSMEERGTLAVMFIDLDHFKAINYSYGHRVGDQLLAVVGARLSQVVRADDVAARMGGDEFACLLMSAPSRVHIAQVANKLFDGIAAPIQLDSLKLQVSPSIGIAISRSGVAENAEQLLGAADRAMYLAKREKCRFAFAHQDVQVGPTLCVATDRQASS